MERPIVAGAFEPLTPESDRPEAVAPTSGVAVPGEIAEAAPTGAPAGPVIVELLGANAQVRYRTRLTTLPAVLGRGYDADVLIDDPHVDARHAELTRDENGGLVLRDLGSVNGVGRTARERSPSVMLASGDRARIGPVEIRVVDASHAVAAAMPMIESRGMTTRIAEPKRALAVCAGAALVFALSDYQSSDLGDAVVPALQGGIYLTVGIAIWASAWALATRIVSRGFRFLAHWAWILAMSVTALVLSTAGEWMDFAGPSLELGSWLVAAGGLVLFPVLIAGHLEIASSMSRSKRWRAALSVTAIALALAALGSLGEEFSYSGSLGYSSTLKPLPARLIPVVSLDDFMRATAGLQAEVDELAEEPAPDEDEPADAEPELLMPDSVASSH
jgi:hypothetical protein